ncbi:MAG TPA: hypothetical protein PKH61_05610 [Microbacteriaceae bacterium]|nr:hypothetical protein [Microbacteriaceae bacterium]
MPAPPAERPGASGFVPRGTPEPAPRPPRTAGRRRLVLAALAAVLLGVALGAWAAVVAAQQEPREPPGGGRSGIDSHVVARVSVAASSGLEARPAPWNMSRAAAMPPAPYATTA